VARVTTSTSYRIVPTALWLLLSKTSLELLLLGKVRYYYQLHNEGYILIHIPDVNLSELQKTLDAQGIELVENQKESVVGRKALADRTKGLYHYHCLAVIQTVYTIAWLLRRLQEDSG
jgi:hypothetical protein